MRLSGDFFFPAGGERLQPVLTDRFQHQEARFLTSFTRLLQSLQ